MDSLGLKLILCPYPPAKKKEEEKDRDSKLQLLETHIPSLSRNITEHHFHCQQKVNLKQTAAAGSFKIEC